MQTNTLHSSVNMRLVDCRCSELSSELCGEETKVKRHVTIRSCLHLWKQNMQCMACKSDFPGVHMLCCWCETELAVDSHHWRSFLLAAAAMEVEKIDLSTSP